VKQHTFVDATTEEELSTSSRITFAYDGEGNMCAIRQEGDAELEFAQLDSLISVRISSQHLTASVFAHKVILCSKRQRSPRNCIVLWMCS
jgi:exosome complex RNA-binding protein Rrp42 (RNase PH superfamily)